jgi:hypothetical protein
MRPLLLALLLTALPAQARNKKKVIGLSLMSAGAALTAVGAVTFFKGAIDSGLVCLNWGGCHQRQHFDGRTITGLSLLSLGVAAQIASVPLYAQGVAEGETLQLSVTPLAQGAAAALSIRF